MLIRITILFLFLALSSLVGAHYDNDDGRTRHWYISSAFSPDASVGTIAEMQESIEGQGWLWCEVPEIQADLRFKIFYDPIAPFNCAQVSYKFLYENHCNHEDQFFIDGGCTYRGDVCAADKNTINTYVTHESYAPPIVPVDGYNADGDVTAPFYPNCSYTFLSVTPFVGGAEDLVTVQFHATGDNAIDENGLPYALEDTDPYPTCMPPAYDEQTGQVADIFGQDDCYTTPEEQGSGGADNEGDDDTNPANQDPDTPVLTNVGNEGIEERLDILIDQADRRADVLESIDSELDEIDSNTTVAAAAAVGILVEQAATTVEAARGADASEGILAEMQDDTATGATDCAVAPTCSGDAIQCAQLQQSWALACETLEYDPTDPTEDIEGDGITDLDATMDQLEADILDDTGQGIDSEASGLESWITGILPSQPACSDYSIDFFGKGSLNITCAQFADWRAMLAWLFFIFTAWTIFQLTITPLESKV